jgi:hypothetical protein
MAKQSAGAPPATEWRRLGSYLWAGTGEYGPVGTIEQGRRFKAVDTEGTVIARCRDLGEAQAVLEHLALAERVALNQSEHSAAA